MSTGLTQQAVSTLHQIKAQLQQPKPQPDHNVKADLYSHLTEVFNRILQYNPKDAYDKFEEISNLVKQTNLKFQDPKYDFELNAPKANLSREQAAAYLKKIRNLIKEIPDVGVRPGDGALLSKD
jgi:hypothetical protein